MILTHPLPPLKRGDKVVSTNVSSPKEGLRWRTTSRKKTNHQNASLK